MIAVTMSLGVSWLDGCWCLEDLNLRITGLDEKMEADCPVESVGLVAYRVFRILVSKPSRSLTVNDQKADGTAWQLRRTA